MLAHEGAVAPLPSFKYKGLFMNLTITQIITEIITEVGGDTSDSDFAAIMLVCFKSGIRKVPIFARDRLILVQEDLTLAAAAQTLDLTTLTNGFIKENHLWYVGTNGIRVPIYKPPSREYFNNLYNTGSSGKPTYYIINGKTMQFEKKADESLTIGIEFFKELSDIETSDTFFGDERLLEACKGLCKHIYYRDYEEDSTKGKEHQIEARDILFVLEGEYEDQELAGHITERNYY